jgi:hypothetical protein
VSVNPISSSPVVATTAVDFTEAVGTSHSALAPARHSILTSGDLEVITVMFGPEMAHNAVKAASGDTNTHSNEFVNILIANRQSGFLPTGTQISGAYLQAMYDEYANYSGPGQVTNPLTRRNLADALAFLKQHHAEGSLIDTQA